MSDLLANRKFFTVSQVNRYAKRLLESDALLAGMFIEGEISNFTAHGSGHMYFSLKDNASTLSAVMFNGHASALNFTPQSGLKVNIFGRLSLYEKTGQYQLYVEFMEPAGVGGLHMAFTQLCDKLKAEGLFDEERKRPLPPHARCVAIITSPTGAAVQDILTTAKQRDPSVRIVIAPALVQGEAAPADLVRALHEVNNWGQADVIILGRGGGSTEDLWAFNDEAVARAIAASKIPVISAVGHETDFSVADFVADARAATPTAAAQLAVADGTALLSYVRNFITDLHETLQDRLQQHFHHAQSLTQNLTRHIQTRLAHEQLALSHKTDLLEKSSPYAAFARGMAYVQNEKNQPITSAKKIHTGNKITLHWADGSVQAEVTHEL
ncbi:MAG: exodeoxyribonuclease VII large subunit [Defluviitaleaceae bacterium]|nr:exodeoxyribonuclease VII large subunit [Defluviitaleaceae bacterium]